MENLVEHAKQLSFTRHRNHVDKEGNSYFGYIERVVATMIDIFDDVTDEDLAIVYLHNAVDNQGLTVEKLEEYGYPESVIQSIKNISRNLIHDKQKHYDELQKKLGYPHKDLYYHDFIRGLGYQDWIKWLVSIEDKSAIRTKFCENLVDGSEERIASLPESDRLIIRSYHNERKTLLTSKHLQTEKAQAYSV